MSPSEKATTGSPKLDIPKLHTLPSEQQDFVLLTHVGDLESYIETCSLNQEKLSAKQDSLVQEILKIVNLPTPVPNRAIRASLGRCFENILGKGNRKPLYESINQLLEIINTSKQSLPNRHAAVYCIGKIYIAAGDSAISLANVCCSSILKLSKSAQHHAGLRAAIVRALGSIILGTNGGIDETSAREVWKHARNVAANDKSGLAQSQACWCLEQLVKGTKFFINTNDFEALKSTLWRTFDSPWQVARRAAAYCLAEILFQSYSEHANDPSSQKSKKARKSNKVKDLPTEDGSEEESRPTSPSKRKDKSNLELNLTGILRQLSDQYVRASTSNRSRIAIARCYIKVCKSMEPSLITRKFGVIADHLLFDVVSNTHINQSRYRLLLTRRLLQSILVDCICSKILSESARQDVSRDLLNEVVKNYPCVIKEKPEPPKQALIVAIDTVTSLVTMLGSAFSPVADTCRESLLQVLQHTSYSVQIHASRCLRELSLSCPQQLIPCASICMNSVSRELGQLATGRHSPRRCVGYANGLAAVLSISGLRPLFGSLDINAGVLRIATELLKSSSQAELRIASTQIQVAWILIGGLMALGPNFVKIHVSQLLMLWRNALPRPLKEANAGHRQSSEVTFLVHLRESTLGSILSFLHFNTKLVTADVAQKIAAMLHNTIDFLESLGPKATTEESMQRSNFSLNCSDLVMMVRRRILQCFTHLLRLQPTAITESFTRSGILIMASSLFADPEALTPASLEAAIANSAGNFETIWDIADNSAFGITGLVRGHHVKSFLFERERPQLPRWLENDEDFESSEDFFLSPIIGAIEHDSANVAVAGDVPDPPDTEVVNAAIALFAIALPLQTPKIQEAIIEQLSSFLKSPAFHRNPGRRAAVTVNITFTLLAALKVTTGETFATTGDLRSAGVEKGLERILKELVIDPDTHVRTLAQHAIGKLCESSGTALTSSTINALIDTVIANRDPNARAGCAMALGSIHAQLGGMAAGLHLQKIHGVLLSLCSDANAVVHFAATEALAKVTDSAGLAFSGYVSSTLGLVSSLWSSDTHNEECSNLNTSNRELDHPTANVLASLVDSLVNVLGPDLQHTSKVRDLILRIVQQFQWDSKSSLQLESLQILGDVHLYDAHHVDLRSYVSQLQKALESHSSKRRQLGVDGLYDLVRRDVVIVISAADQGFEDMIWNVLSRDPTQEGVRNIVRVWLGQTALVNTALWLSRFQRVFTASTTQEAESAVPLANEENGAVEIQDEEVAGFAVSETPQQKTAGMSVTTQELLNWQVRDFVLDCLSNLIESVGKDIERDPTSAAGQALQQKISDVIRLAFLASTASVVELRVKGMKLIDQVLIIYGSTPDPDFAEALLLEQYQAQISSALTPAFSVDSSPELAAAAIKVCATFIATGLVTDVDRMGRTLRSLVTALNSFAADTRTVSIGDLKGLSTNAQTMIRMAVLTAWADLQIASTERDYLVKVVEPHLRKLIPLWLSSLQEFARLRFEPDISSSMGPAQPDEDVDVVYASMNRQTLLQFYQDSWLRLVNAVASLIDQNSDFVFEALDNRPDSRVTNGNHNQFTDIDYREEPSAFFFVLFGIAIEALVTQSGNADASILDILRALKRILRPSVAGNAMFQEAVFTEFVEILGRLALTEGLDVQAVIVDIVRDLCLSHPSAVSHKDNHHTNLSDDVEQLFELARIIVLILARAVPNLGEQLTPGQTEITNDVASVIRSSLDALVDASSIFPSIIKKDLHACVFHTFTTILGTAACQALAVPQSLPIFKRFLLGLTSEDTTSTDDFEVTEQLLGCLTQFIAILSHAQRRESEAALPCAKNTLLAMTILLTTSSKSLSPTTPLITRCLDDYLDCLADVGLAKVSAGCLRSLLLAPNPANETDAALVSYLLPRILRFVTDSQCPDPEGVRPILTQALTSFATSNSGYMNSSDAQAAVYILVLPAILQRAVDEGLKIYTEIASRVLDLAGANQPLFRGVVQKLDTAQRALMEKIIREGGISAGKDGGNGKKASREESGEPSIALKFSFG